ncbi:MAG TPA: Ig-like domain-containing protein [Candidatus Paceibacterota bacterium]|nr:Ig-like domain-containing protein [Candidatus Paceibacterota bacterium]
MKMRVLAVLATVMLLFGCGGGGGGSSDSAAPAAQNPSSSTTSTAEVKALSTTPAKGAVVPPDSFSGVTYQFSGALDPASVKAAGNITLWAGASGIPGNAVPLTVTVSADGKSFTVTTTGKLNYSQPYVLTVKGLTDSLGRPIQVDDLAFSTTGLDCTGLTAWSTDYETCKYPVGTQIVSIKQLQDSSCTSDKWTWDNACFVTAVHNGTVQIAESLDIAENDDPVIFALFADAADVNVILPFDVVNPKAPKPIGGNILAGLPGAVINWATGNMGIRLNLSGIPTVGLYQFMYNPTNKAFVGELVTP